MFNFLFRKYHYYIVVKAQLTNKDNIINSNVYKFTKRYFFWRGRSVQYFEPFISKEAQDTYAVFGTAKGERKVNRNCLIFILELYAALSQPTEYKISNEFTKSFREINGTEITIYRVKK